MYAWIWRHLPYGRPGKIIGSAVLIGSVVALLWFVVFPWAEPLLPFDDVQVTDGGGGVSGGDPATGGDPAGDEHDLPYDPATNNPAPSDGP